MHRKTDWIIPDCPFPDRVRAMQSTRYLCGKGKSLPPWDSFNLALHVGDNEQHVQQNRKILSSLLPGTPLWLQQTHSSKVLAFNHDGDSPIADGSYSTRCQQICCVLTADCLPILFSFDNAAAVAAVHAGWRGLQAGIIDQAVAHLCRASSLPANRLQVWLGAAIGPHAFEVGAEVRALFVQKQHAYEQAFMPVANKKYLADLYQLARINLHLCGVDAVFGGEYCTYHQQELFFSFRRDGNKSGRMASLIWIEKD